MGSRCDVLDHEVVYRVGVRQQVPGSDWLKSGLDVEVTLNSHLSGDLQEFTDAPWGYVP